MHPSLSEGNQSPLFLQLASSRKAGHVYVPNKGEREKERQTHHINKVQWVTRGGGAHPFTHLPSKVRTSYKFLTQVAALASDLVKVLEVWWYGAQQYYRGNYLTSAHSYFLETYSTQVIHVALERYAPLQLCTFQYTLRNR